MRASPRHQADHSCACRPPAFPPLSACPFTMWLPLRCIWANSRLNTSIRTNCIASRLSHTVVGHCMPLPRLQHARCGSLAMSCRALTPPHKPVLPSRSATIKGPLLASCPTHHRPAVHSSESPPCSHVFL
jgi:hypothetical protein